MLITALQADVISGVLKPPALSGLFIDIF